MLQLTRKVDVATDTSLNLTLNYEQRSKSRLRATLDDNIEVAIKLERGVQIFPGDVLQSDSGETVRIVAANENVSVVTSDDTHLLAKACYHLGNRHVALQIEPDQLRYIHDHVLDEMVALLGLDVVVQQTSFEPETGAYGAHAHIHGH